MRESTSSITFANAPRDSDIVFTMLPSGKHVQSLLSGDKGVFALAAQLKGVADSADDISDMRAG